MIAEANYLRMPKDSVGLGSGLLKDAIRCRALVVWVGQATGDLRSKRSGFDSI